MAKSRKSKINVGLPRQWLWRLSAHRRHQIADIFLQRMAPIGRARTLLDVGGPGPATVELARHFGAVYAVNVNRDWLSPSRFNLPGRSLRVQADGKSLPFADKSVDFIFSDNVIEHVTEREKFTDEISRVAKIGFLITTPNYWFPFEPHYHFPFVQFLPPFVKRRLLEIADFGFITANSEDYIRLLTVSELRGLFPRAAVEGIGFLSRRVPETLVVWHRN